MGRREDPHETKDLAQELPDVLESLKQRYLELKATALDQRVMLSKVQAGTQRLFPNWIKMLQTNKGFVSLEPAAFLHRGGKIEWRAKLLILSDRAVVHGGRVRAGGRERDGPRRGVLAGGDAHRAALRLGR